ncbi:MAG: HEPN domain-containing protein [Candidatus Binatia bacterium]
MKRRTVEWVEKAEGDSKMGKREMQAVDPHWDGICFLAQQCAEKYLKALLEEHNITFQKTHDLVALLDLSKGLLPELDPIRSQLAHLSTFGLAARYPGVRADRQASENALKTVENVRTVVRRKLGLP